MAQPLRPPAYLQPRSKAPPTFGSTSLDAAGTSVTPPKSLSRTSSRSRHASPSRLAPTTDGSDKATAALVRRVLCPQSHGGTADPHPLDELLPPLTSSNDVDLQLYAIIAIVVKEFVYSWYGKITPDQVFVEEVIRIFAHCTRALEQRMRAVDFGSLVLDEIPQLVQSHISAYQASHQPFRPGRLETDPKVVYHTLIPHPALSPVPDSTVPATVTSQAENEAAYRQLLVQGVLAVILPTEDLTNVCLRTLVADVIGEMILGNGISGKACEGWVIWEGVTKLVESIKARLEPKATGEEIQVDTRSRLEKFGLLSEKKEKGRQHFKPSRSSAVSEVFWRVLQYAYLTFVVIRFAVLGLIASSSRAGRSPLTPKSPVVGDYSPRSNGSNAPGPHRPILQYKIFSLIAQLLDLGSRMPWLFGSISLLQHHVLTGPFASGATDGLVDKFLSHLLTAHLLTPTLLPPLLQTLRTTLFPSNTLSPSRAPPPPSQRLALRRSAAASIHSLLPPLVARRYFATADTGAQVDEIERVLDVFGDDYMNRHVMYGILELVVVRIVPEVGSEGVRELVEGRLGMEEGERGEMDG